MVEAGRKTLPSARRFPAWWSRCWPRWATKCNPAPNCSCSTIGNCGPNQVPPGGRFYAAKADLTRLDNEPRPEQLGDGAGVAVRGRGQHGRSKRPSWPAPREFYARKVTTDQELVTRQQAYRMSRARYARAKAEFECKRPGPGSTTRALRGRRWSRPRPSSASANRAGTAGRPLAGRRRSAASQRASRRVRRTPPSQALVVLGKIDNLHVRIDIDEHDIPRFRPGSRAQATLKGQPKVQFRSNSCGSSPTSFPNGR